MIKLHLQNLNQASTSKSQPDPSPKYFTRRGHINQIYLTGVSLGVSDKGSQRLDSCPIKKQVVKRTVKNILYVLVIIRKEGAGAEVRFVHAGGSVKFLPVV